MLIPKTAVAKICCALAPSLCALWSGKAAQAQGAIAAPTAETIPAGPQFLYRDGKLTIHALNASLADVLAKVSALLGVSIDVPDGARKEMMPMVVLGPAPAREVLASLLSGAHFDYMLQASETDPDKLQSLLILSRAKPAVEGPGTDAAIPRSPFSRAAPAPAEAEQTPDPAPRPLAPDTSIADAAGASPQNAPTSPDQPTPGASPQRDIAASPRVSPLSPPATLTPQSISGQLQQMYQQRMQMQPAGRPASAPAPQQ